MAVECANHSSKCDHCGYTLQPRDCKKILMGELRASPEEADYVTHCICYQCGEEWVE